LRVQYWDVAALATTMLCSSVRAVIDADALHRVSDASLRQSVVAHLRDDLLSPEQHGIALVLTDWQGRMPDDVRAILAEFVRAQDGGHGLKLTSLDLHGKVGWFIELLYMSRGAFEASDSWLQALEVSLVEDDSGRPSLGCLPLFGNLRSLRVYQPAFGTELAEPLAGLLRHNLQRLNEFACVAQASAAPFRAALQELNVPIGGASTVPLLSSLAADKVVAAGASATSIEENGYPALAVATVAHAEVEAKARETRLWLRGREEHVLEALRELGRVIAYNRSPEATEHRTTFLARLRSLKLDVTQLTATGGDGLGGLPSALSALQTQAAHLLRDERLGSDVRLQLRLEIEAHRPSAAQEEVGLMCLVDVTAASIGLESASGLFLPVLPRNTTIPSRRSVRLRWDTGAFVPLATSITPATPAAHAAPDWPAAAGPSASTEHQARTRTMRIFEGERLFVADNETIGELEVLSHERVVDITFEVNANGLLRVRSTLLEESAQAPIALTTWQPKRWVQDDLERHLAQAMASAEADRAKRRALLEPLGLSETAFLAASAMYGRHVLTVGDVD